MSTDRLERITEMEERIDHVAAVLESASPLTPEIREDVEVLEKCPQENMGGRKQLWPEEERMRYSSFRMTKRESSAIQ